MDKNNKNESNQNNENCQTKEKENINQKENKEEITLLKDIDLIQQIKKNNYQDCVVPNNFVDFRPSEENSWNIGLIVEIKESTYTVKDVKDGNKYIIKKSDSKRISYLRKYSLPDKEDNIYSKRDKEKDLLQKLNFLEKVTKGEQSIFNMDKVWYIYYILHSRIFFGLDAAMKVNNDDQNEDGNEGIEISFRIILCILLFLRNYYKYILENIEEFIYYKKEIINTELEDLKIINKKCAFFSFFDESYDLLSKIFGNIKYCLYWYKGFENELNSIIPFYINDENKNGETKIENKQDYPIYEEEKDEEKNSEKNVNKVKLKKICLDNAYDIKTTYTTERMRIKSRYISYFIDYFNAINGFSYLAQLLYSSKNIDINLFNEILQIFYFSRILTNSYSKTLFDEKKKICEYFGDLIEKFDKKLMLNNNIKDISLLAKSLNRVLFKDNPKIKEKLINYIIKSFFASKKMEQKINSLTALNEILKNLENYDSELTLKDFCEIIDENIKLYLEENEINDIKLKQDSNKIDENKINIQILNNQKDINIKRLNDIKIQNENNNNNIDLKIIEDLKIELNKEKEKNIILEKLSKEEKYKNKEYDNIIMDLKSRLEKEVKKNNELNKKLEKERDKFSKIELLNEKKETMVDTILEKDKEMKELKLKLSRFPLILEEGEAMMIVTFISSDQQLHYSVLCKNTDEFYKIEGLLYKEYPGYAENENYFLVDGQKINKYKTLEQNGIKNNSQIILIKIE